MTVYFAVFGNLAPAGLGIGQLGQSAQPVGEQICPVAHAGVQAPLPLELLLVLGQPVELALLLLAVALELVAVVLVELVALVLLTEAVALALELVVVVLPAPAPPVPVEAVPLGPVELCAEWLDAVAPPLPPIGGTSPRMQPAESAAPAAMPTTRATFTTQTFP